MSAPTMLTLQSEFGPALLASKRGEGRTRAMIILAVDTGRTLVVMDHRFKLRCVEEAQRLFGVQIKAMTWHEFARGAWLAANHKGFAVDDVDGLLNTMAKGQQVIGTWCTPTEGGAA